MKPMRVWVQVMDHYSFTTYTQAIWYQSWVIEDQQRLFDVVYSLEIAGKNKKITTLNIINYYYYYYYYQGKLYLLVKMGLL